MSTTTTDQATTSVETETPATSEGEIEMCCDGSGKTADQHRAESADHKCCVDT